MNSKQYYNKFASEWINSKRNGAVNTLLTHTFTEEPSMNNYLRTHIKNKRILCIGCGSGEECLRFSEMGAKEVVGIDVSDKLIAQARKDYPNVRFEVGGWKELPRLKFGLFDYVYAGFSIHYVKDWQKVCNDVSSILKPKGEFIFSTIHPLRNAIEKEKVDSCKTKLFGIVKDTKTSKVIRKYGNYFNEGTKELKLFLGDEFVPIYKKTFATIVNELASSKLQIVKFIEPTPRKKASTYDPAGYEQGMHIPGVLIAILRKE